MQCPACTRQVAAWADFCPHCGAAQSVTYAVEPVSDRASLTDEVFGWGEPAASEDVEDIEGVEDIEAAKEEAAFPADPTPVEPLPVVNSTDPLPVLAADEHLDGGLDQDADPVTMGDDPAPSAASGRWLIIAAGAFVAVTLLVILWSVLRVDTSSDSGPSASPSGAQSQAPATPSGPATTSTSPSATPSPLPAGAISCGTSGTQGSPDTAAIFTPDPNTTCPFAQAVATAYRTAAPNGGEATVTANSPVTGQDYQLTCTGALPTICRADSGATVYLTRG